ncbi:membrane-bound lytic murein transglycosylase MltF [Parvibaculum sp.]|uniref:membrane-bound lytic murein transglycosylase MltF n=1 Tax=Parvibaculum sp. TaxID=2024848 RepID=UPI0032107E3C
MRRIQIWLETAKSDVLALLPPWSDRRAPYLVFAGLLLFAAALAYYLVYLQPVSQGLGTIRRSGTLVVITRVAPTTYYSGTLGETGYEYDMAQALGKALGVRVEYRTYDTEPEVLEALAARRGQLAIGLVATEARRKAFVAGPDYQTVREVIACRRDIALPKRPEDLVGLRIAVAEGTAGSDAMNGLATKTKGLSFGLKREPVENILAAVADGELDCTVASSLELQINNPYYPELAEAFAITGDQPLAWLAAPGSEDVVDYLADWIADLKKAGELAEIGRRYFGFLPPFDYVDVRAFRDAIKTTLPEYEKAMRDAADKTGLPWQLIAAVAYQESHWKSDARSHTGVRGIMMLTEDTADALGVADRLDPIASIYAGARYIADIEKRIPDSVREPDRIWFALAAYNMGFAHLQDARSLAERLGLDPDSWTGVRRALTLIQKPAYAEHLKYGTARGGQALRFVQQVRAYRHILEAPRG